jgi:hypothetical protein
MALSMRRIGMLVTVVALMAAMVVAMAMPAFAAKPTSFEITCPAQMGDFVTSADNGRQFGQHNRVAAQSGYRGSECERTIE